MKQIKITFLFLLTSLVMSCGFHLRGAADLSAVIPDVQLRGMMKHDVLTHNLTEALSQAKVNVLDEAKLVLDIKATGFSKRVLSIDSAGRANQYELSYQLSFALLEKIESEHRVSEKSVQNSKIRLVEIIPLQTITEKREYVFDSNIILAKADEENRLKADMKQAALLQLIRRLTYSLKSKQHDAVQTPRKEK